MGVPRPEYSQIRDAWLWLLTPSARRISHFGGRRYNRLEAHADLAGDITAGFHDYSHDEAEAHMLKSLSYFRPNLTADSVRQVLALFEGFACEPVKK
jgi:hypothetical protein